MSKFTSRVLGRKISAPGGSGPRPICLQRPGMKNPFLPDLLMPPAGAPPTFTPNLWPPHPSPITSTSLSPLWFLTKCFTSTSIVGVDILLISCFDGIDLEYRTRDRSHLFYNTLSFWVNTENYFNIKYWLHQARTWNFVKDYNGIW